MGKIHDRIIVTAFRGKESTRLAKHMVYGITLDETLNPELTNRVFESLRDRHGYDKEVSFYFSGVDYDLPRNTVKHVVAHV
jgi:hypothetical protein